MSTVMTTTAREQYLADRHVGVLSVVAGGTDPAATLAVPIWYDYAPGTGVWVLTGPTTKKGVALESARRFALTAQSEDIPYKYVSVEGPITEIRPADPEADVLPMAIRYFGDEMGTAYYEQVRDEATNLYVMQPERWWSTDLTEVFESLGHAATGSAPA